MADTAGRPSLAALARQFGARFWFSHTRVWDHVAVTAVRHDLSEPGIACVITEDADEMRDVLEQDQAAAQDFPARRLTPPGAGPGTAGERPG